MKAARIKYYLAILFCWAVLIVSLIIVDFYKIQEESDKIAITEALTNFKKDHALRYWAASHGGVYVPVDSITKPNPALSHIPERDIETPSGKQLTLMSPTYMIREMNEYFEKHYGVVGHITSKKLLRHENKPDEWELNALNQFEKGIKEVSDYSEINGEPYLRLMQPMITKQECLKCHAHQGYKVGDIRGGVGIALPMKQILKLASRHKKRTLFTFILIWFIGFTGLTYGYVRLSKSIHRQEQTEETLRIQNNELLKTKQNLQEQNNDYVVMNEELKASEEEIKVINEELIVKSKELKKINEELLTAKEKAEESDRLKNEFINNMSHEIRTPMNGILGFSMLLNKPNITNEKREHYISIIQNSGSQLLRIIDDILEISKLGTKQVKAVEKEICLNDLFLELFSIFDIKAKENRTPLYLCKGLNDKDSIIYTDKSKLNKILSNLLTNALKFTNDGYVEFGYQLIENKLEIYVKDTICLFKIYNMHVFSS